MANPRSRTRPARTGGVTLLQVAEHAGVSLATASRVLHGSGTRTVGEELRRRVESAAEELRYISNAPAQALARSTSSVVGLIVHDVADPYFGAIAAGAMRAAREHRLLVMIAATFREPGLELEYLRGLRAQRARAVILAGSGTVDAAATERLAEEIAGFEADGGRVVCIGERGPDLDTVAMANRSGGGLAVQGLWELGHRRIGVVSGPEELLTVRHRLDGARRALRALGAPWDPGAVRSGDFTREGGRGAAVRLLTERPELTGVLVLNDVMAAGALAGLRDDLGLAVPEQVSVVGFDDVPFAADLCPPLSTVRLPLEAAGEAALRLVLEDGAEVPRQVKLPAELILRGSTGLARR
ncbi:LacI family transcriptional regulator [Streptacidiphilus sp. MAP12-20]|uniref:LacI family DNA-binding transcriptional regulator n=1 Tax=Streptacidiphilus sp. MAP12-20 TaxID=3156299 RepID=UPI00351413B0